MSESHRILTDEEGEEEHEEGEISDEEPPPPSNGEGEEGESATVEENEAVEPAAELEAAISTASAVRESSVMQRLTGLDDIFEAGDNELRAGQNRKQTNIYRDKGGRDLGSTSLKRNGWATATYGSYTQFAWTQAVSGQAMSGRSFNTVVDSPSLEGAESSKLSRERRVLSRSGSSGSWSTDTQKKLSRTFSRDSEAYERSTGRSSEERDDLSPLREISSSRVGERLGERVSDSTRRGRSRETSWSERERELSSSRVERQIVRSRIEKAIDNGGCAEGLDTRRGLPTDSAEGRSRKQRSPETGSQNGTSNENDGARGSSSWTSAAKLGQDVENKTDAAEDREEGELEEGEIELISLPSDQRSESPSKETQDTGRQSKYSGIMEADDSAKERVFARSYSSKSNSRPQIDDYSSRRYRQPRPQESMREKQLSMAGELVKNVTVKDAQRSFVDVCGRLHKALKVLDELHSMSRQDVFQEGREESLPVAITGLSRQAFAGIRAVYAVRNTASGREQERDKNIFPRLLELANGYCQKLFTPKQVRELQVMMQTIANAGRVVRNGDAEKVQYQREHQPQPGPPGRSIDQEAKPAGNSLAIKGGTAITSISNKKEQPKTSNAELSLPGRILGFVDAKQAKEAAAIAAAALAYAQNSAAAAASANPLIGNTNDSRATAPPPAPAQPQGPVSWGWASSGIPPQIQFPNLAMHAFNPNNRVHNPTMGKFQAWSAADQLRSAKPGGQQDEYGGHPLEAKAKDATTTITAPPTFPFGSKGDVGMPSGNSNVPGSSTNFAMTEDDWERLSPSAGDAKPILAPLPAVRPSQAAFGGVTDESSSRGKVWPTRPEVGSYEIGSGGGRRQYPMDQHLLNPNQQRSVDAAAHVYTMERLPSPTPDENEDGAPQPPPAMVVKPGFRGGGVNTMPTTVTPLQQGNNPNMASSFSALGSAQILKRSQSLDDQAAPAVIDPNLTLKEKPPREPALLLTTKSSDDTDSMKTAGALSLPPKGPFRRRDPRRRFQSHSMEFLEMDGLEQSSSQVANSGPDNSRFVGGAPYGSETNKRRFVPDTDETHDLEMQKRLKVQSESRPAVNGFSVEHTHGSSATGGWLDDNVEPSFGAGEDVSTDMEIDGEGPIVGGLEGRKGISGSEVKVKNDGRLAFLPDPMKTTSANKRTMDVGQQMLDSGNWKIRPRDPRRAYLENKVERGVSSSTDKVRADEMSALKSSDIEVGGSLPRATADSESWNKDAMQGTGNKLGGASVQNIGPNFAERMSSTAVTFGGSSALQVTKSQHIVGSGGGQVVSASLAVTTKAGTLVESTIGVEGASAVASEEVSHQELEQFVEKPTPANLGPTRKPKGNASQWGASQVHPGLEQLLEDLSDEERLSVQLERKRRMEEQDRMFSAGKLCLVLDLDHTLLNSAKFSEIEQEWDQRLRVAETAERNRVGRDGLERRELYRFPHMSMWTKLRPGIWKFLAKASQLYELHVYTMGNKVYATEMAKVLDPTGKLFAGRVISKGDDGDGDELLPKSKDLDGVLGMESAVVIIDDSAKVWPHHSGNLIVVERYMYFPCSRRQFGLAGPSLLEVGHDERESDGMLASALGVIDKIHQKFFKNPRLREVDVREILAAQQKQVLAGCKVVFSRVFPVGEAEPHRHPLWRTAEQFGAICTIAIDDLVTHVVAISLGTDKVNWALETGRYVVRPAWLEASTILYRRANEREFPVLLQ